MLLYRCLLQCFVLLVGRLGDLNDVPDLLLAAVVVLARDLDFNLVWAGRIWVLIAISGHDSLPRER